MVEQLAVNEKVLGSSPSRGDVFLDASPTTLIISWYIGIISQFKYLNPPNLQLKYQIYLVYISY